MFSLFPKHEYSPVLNKQSLQHWLDPFFRQFFFLLCKIQFNFFLVFFSWWEVGVCLEESLNRGLQCVMKRRSVPL